MNIGNVAQRDLLENRADVHAGFLRITHIQHSHLFRENLAHKLGDDVDEFGIKFLLKIPGSARDVFGELYRSSLSSELHPCRTKYT